MQARELAKAIGHARQAEARWLPEFLLEYRIVSGPPYGSAFQYEQRLQIRGNGEVRLFRRRASGDTAVLPVGLFEGRIDREEVLGLLQALEQAPLDSLSGGAAMPGDPIFSLSGFIIRKCFAFEWSLLQPPFPDSLSALFDILNNWMTRDWPIPLWSLSLKVVSARLEAGALEAVLRLENPGSQPIHIVHPESPGGPEAMNLGLIHGIKPKEEEGYTPLPMEIEEEILAVNTRPDVELVPVSADRAFEFTVRSPVNGTHGGGRIGVFAYACYLLPDGVAGLPVFAGAVFSEETPL